MRLADSGVSGKSVKGTGKRLPRNNSRQIDDMDEQNLENLAASSASNLLKTPSDFLLSTKPANATFGKAAGVLARGNYSNIFGPMQQLPTTWLNTHFGNNTALNKADRTKQAIEMFKKYQEDLSKADSDENVPAY